MARQAPPAPVLVDVVELGELADARPIPLPAPTPWAKGDEPLWESVDLNELPNQVLRMKVCRSFRADLRHKLVLIVRAHGGYGHGGIWKSCGRLKIKRNTLWRWLNWVTSPRLRHQFEIIDSAYEEAVQILTVKAMARRAKLDKRRKQSPAPQPCAASCNNTATP